MKMLFITSVFPSPLRPNNGAFNAGMVRGLAAPALEASAGDEIKVIAPVPWPTAYRAWRAGRPYVNTSELSGVEIRHPVYYYTPKVLRGQYGAFFEWSMSAAVSDLLRTFQPQVVLGYWSHPDGHAAIRMARRLGVPGAVMVGGTDVLVLGRNPARRRAIEWVLQRSDAIITVSQDLKRALGQWGCNTGKIHVVHRGVDEARFAPQPRAAARERLGIAPETRAIVWVGHMVAVKGLEVLVDACAQAAKVVDFHLYLVGDGPLRAALQMRLQQLGIADRVTFVGYVAHDALGDWYRAANITVLPSLSEGIPNVLLESIACGTPFVASSVGGIPEIADPLIDRLVPVGDAAALANGLVNALMAPSRLPRRTLPISNRESSQRLRDVLLSTVANRFRSASAHVPVHESSPADTAEVQS